MPIDTNIKNFIDWIGGEGLEYWPRRGGWYVPELRKYMSSDTLYEYWESINNQ
jgi:hypothetical protein